MIQFLPQLSLGTIGFFLACDNEDCVREAFTFGSFVDLRTQTQADTLRLDRIRKPRLKSLWHPAGIISFV